MLKYMVLAAVACCAGCQTTQQTAGMKLEINSESERLSLRVEKYVNTYDVSVQHAVQKQAGNGGAVQWVVVSSPRVSGYPGKWRRTEESADPVGYRSTASYLLDGELVGISLRPGVHLVAKVLPESQNTVRVMGVFSRIGASGHGRNGMSIPFDLTCTVGDLNVIYEKGASIDPVVVAAGE